jgi:Zn-dependent peptidase ImmA (M78 family)
MNPNISHIKYIDEIANKALVSADCKQIPIDIEKVAEKFGLKVVDFDFPDSLSGVLKKSRGVIGVNKKHPMVRRRFTIAHELGHLLLGHDLGKDDDVVDDDFDKPIPKEKEANIFASCLLMPAEMVESEVKKLPRIDLKKLAQTFDVSEQTITIRLLNLNLIK